VSGERPRPGSAAGATGAPPRLERAQAPAAAPAPPPCPASPGYGLSAREVGADAAIAAGLGREGTLARESALRLFGLAAAMQATGRLSVAGAGAAYALFFRRGTVEHASSTADADDLGSFLVRRGVLAEGARRRAEASRAAAGRDLATVLVAERLVNPADVAGHLQEHGVGLVQRALAVEDGAWSWSPDAAAPPSAFPLGSPLAMLSMAVRALDVGVLARRLGDRQHRAATRVGGRLRLEDLRLTAQEARVAQRFDGARSAAELAAASPGDAPLVLALALLLAETDLLAFGAPRPPPPPAARAASPAPGAARPGPPSQAQPAAGARKASPPPPGGAAPPRHDAAARPTAPPPPPPAKAAPLERASLEALVAKLARADRFEVLGVDRGATAGQIKAAYFQAAKTYHPDAIAPDAPADVRKLCADVFAKVSDAWSVLGGDESRAAYLEELASGGAPSVDVMAIFQAESAFQAGTLLVKARRYAEALARFDEAIALNAAEAEFSIWRAFCEFALAPDRKRKLAESGAEVERALERNPRCAQGYLFLGQMAKIAGDVALAERQLRRGLEVAPEHPELQRELKYLKK
jgi:hypothetical protein